MAVIAHSAHSQNLHNEEKTTDTLIKHLRLIDSVTDDKIFRMMDHVGYAFRFEKTDISDHDEQIDIIFFAPEHFGKNLFQFGRVYNIYAKKFDGRHVVQPFTDWANLK